MMRDKKNRNAHPSVLVSTSSTTAKTPVSRAGLKLDAALRTFGINVIGKICADFGSNAGGFVETLLKHGAKKVYAVEKGYGVLDWSLRKDPRVVTLEKTDARLVTLPEKVDLISSDTGWTRLEQILPSITRHLTGSGSAVVLVKPHYEAQREELIEGKAIPSLLPVIEQRTLEVLKEGGFVRAKAMVSPLLGDKGGNTEWLWLIWPVSSTQRT